MEEGHCICRGKHLATENFHTQEVESMGRHLSMERLVTVKKQSSSHHHGCEFLLKSAVPLAAPRGIARFFHQLRPSQKLPTMYGLVCTVIYYITT